MVICEIGTFFLGGCAATSPETFSKYCIHHFSSNLQAQLKQAADEAKEREMAAAEQRCRQLESLKQKSRHDQESLFNNHILVI